VEGEQAAAVAGGEGGACLSGEQCAALTAEVDAFVSWTDAQFEASAFVRHENARLLRQCGQAALGDGSSIVEVGRRNVQSPPLPSLQQQQQQQQRNFFVDF
jgi:hypothetical protein